MKLRAPSPALIISCIALVVALSASAYAATKISSSSQIKNGIITSADIKNKTIQTTDLSKSTLKRIDGGGANAASNAAAIEGIRKIGPVNQPANQLIKVATLTIPAGAYVISAKTTLAGTPAPPSLIGGLAAATGDCKLDAAGDEDLADTTILITNRQTPGTMYMQTTRTVGGSAAITLTCSSSSGFSATNTSIIAQRVGSTDQKEIGDS